MSDGVLLSIFVAVDPETAFAVFTDEVDRWWRRGPVYRFGVGDASELRFEPGVGGRLIEVAGDGSSEPYEVGRILAWEPGARLVFEFRPRNFAAHEVTEVEVRFVAAEGGTEVRLEHRGWEALRPDHPARHGLAGERLARLHGDWWLTQLRALRSRMV